MKNLEEKSKDKQRRLKCITAITIDNWDCYIDCAFWDGEKCICYEK